MKVAILSILLILSVINIQAAVTLDFGYDVQFNTAESPNQSYDGLGLVGAHIGYTILIDQENYGSYSPWGMKSYTSATISLAQMSITGSSEEGVNGTYTLTSSSGNPLQIVFYDRYDVKLINDDVILQNTDTTSLADSFYIALVIAQLNKPDTPAPGDPVKVNDFEQGEFLLSLSYTMDGYWVNLDAVEGTKAFSAVPEMGQWAVWLGMGILPVVLYTIERREKKKTTGKNAA